MVFRIECFINLKMCAYGRKYAKRYMLYCGMSDFAVQKPTRTISLGFGSSSEAVVKQDRLTDLNIAFRYSKKPSQNKRFVRKHLAVSLSLSLSPYFYDLLSKFANSLGLEDHPTCLIRGKHAYQEL